MTVTAFIDLIEIISEWGPPLDAKSFKMKRRQPNFRYLRLMTNCRGLPSSIMSDKPTRSSSARVCLSIKTKSELDLALMFRKGKSLVALDFQSDFSSAAFSFLNLSAIFCLCT